MSETTMLETTGTTATEDPFRFGWRYVWQRDDKGKLVHAQVPLTAEDVLHPQEEDVIVNPTLHDIDVGYLRLALRRAARQLPQGRVNADVRTDWGVPGIKPHSPDLVVYTNAGERETGSLGTFRPKDFGAVPALVLEVTSPSTRSSDLNAKVVEYHKAGVPFYAIVDYLPESDLSEATVLGFRATPEGYVRLPLDEQGRLWLPPVNLWLAWDKGKTMCFDEQNQWVPDDEETDERLHQSEARNEELQQSVEEAITAQKDAEREAKRQAELRQDAEREAKRDADLRNQAEDRLALMEAELKRLRGEP